MELKSNHTEYDKEETIQVLTWKLISDYDPNSSSLEDAVGEHYTIFKTNEGAYFLQSRSRIQEHFMGDVYDGPEYTQPINREMVCVYAFLHNNQRVIEREGLEAEKKRLVERVLSSVTGEDDKVIRAKKEIYLNLDSIATQVDDSQLPFGDDIKYDLYELQQCLGIGAYRAALAISGRLLELCLKLYCVQKSIDYSEKWMVGQLINQISKSGNYLDSSLKSVWQVINQQRIIGVHVKEHAPIPSKEQAFMVSFAVIDTLKRLLENSNAS